MKVICIKDVIDDDSFPPDQYDPKVGDILTVLRFVRGRGKRGRLYDAYAFKEIPTGFVYDVTDFAPLSQIDETEMNREYKRELTPERLLAHQRRWYGKRLKEETRIEVRSFLRAELHRLNKTI